MSKHLNSRNNGKHVFTFKIPSQNPLFVYLFLLDAQCHEVRDTVSVQRLKYPIPQWVLGKNFFKIYLFQLEDNYNIVMVFGIHQYESTTGIHLSPPSYSPLPHLSPPKSKWGRGVTRHVISLCRTLLLADDAVTGWYHKD